jgi:hypothetical protein
LKYLCKLCKINIAVTSSYDRLLIVAIIEKGLKCIQGFMHVKAQKK